MDTRARAGKLDPATDIVGHEFMGEVVEAGPGNKRLEKGDRVAVPFTISCGECDQCKVRNFSVCRQERLARPPVRDYSDRPGFPAGVESVRGAARRDFEVPRDLRIPEPLRPHLH